MTEIQDIPSELFDDPIYAAGTKFVQVDFNEINIELPSGYYNIPRDSEGNVMFCSVQL